MKTPFRKMSPMLKIINNALIDLPPPSNISTWWKFGSLLRLWTGIFLAMHFTAHVDLAFNSVIHICRDVNYGWLLRTLHANGASFFFICLYLHVGRGMYYSSYYYHLTWTVGVLILFIVMATALLGYVLPWGQMSFKLKNPMMSEVVMVWINSVNPMDSGCFKNTNVKALMKEIISSVSKMQSMV